MRGNESGLETLARKANPNRLDILGDTVHMVSNAAKSLLSKFRSEVEKFCFDVYYDIERSPKQKEQKCHPLPHLKLSHRGGGKNWCRIPTCKWQCEWGWFSMYS